MEIFLNWILLSLLAGTFQTVRNALSRRLSKSLKPMTVTFIRFFYAIPVVIIFVIIGSSFGLKIGQASQEFYGLAFFGAIGQIVGSSFLFYLIGKGGFNKAVMFSRTDAVFAGLIGAVFFGQMIGLIDWFGIILATAGIILISVGKQNLNLQNLKQIMTNPKTLIGFGSGLFMALASLFISIANKEITGGNLIMNSTFSLLVIITMQSIIIGLYTVIKQPGEVRKIRRTWKFDFFVGFFSAIGSLCWFTAFSLQAVALVRIVGQVEILLTIIIGVLVFKEKFSFKELLGNIVLFLGIILIFL